MRAKILLAASAYFNEFGFLQASAMELAFALDISPGHLYYYFKGKNEIAAQLLNKHVAELSALLDRIERAGQGLGDVSVAEKLAWCQSQLVEAITLLDVARFYWRERGALFMSAWPQQRKHDELNQLLLKVAASIIAPLESDLPAAKLADRFSSHDTMVQSFGMGLSNSALWSLFWTQTDQKDEMANQRSHERLAALILSPLAIKLTQ